MVICTNFEDHAPCPTGYIEWHNWAEQMGKTYKQRKCHACGLYTIWEPMRPVNQRAKPHDN